MPSDLTVQAQPTVMQILADAVMRKDVPVDVIERLAKLQGEMMDRDAKMAFAEAFARFKANVPTIVKESAIEVKGTIRSRYAKLDAVAEKVIPALLAESITHRWKTQMADGGRISVTCYLRHVLGYEEEGSTLAFAPDSSGSMNPLQGLGSTTSYLERYTFVASCGIVIKDWDNDGNVNLSDDQQILLNDIKTASNPAELTSAYKEATKHALGAADKTLIGLIMDAKNARVKELSEHA
jgi:hypothetical protein